MMRQTVDMLNSRSEPLDAHFNQSRVNSRPLQTGLPYSTGYRLHWRDASSVAIQFQVCAIACVVLPAKTAPSSTRSAMETYTGMLMVKAPSL
jgi:hypothetical protein